MMEMGPPSPVQEASGPESKRQRKQEQQQPQQQPPADPAATSAADSPAQATTGVEAAARGGHLRGDFPRYYDFHATAPRIQALLGDAEARRVVAAAWGAAAGKDGAPLLLLSDWGSNAGDLTAALACELRSSMGGAGSNSLNVAALGLELNAGLVARARALAGKLEAEGGSEGEGGVALEFEALDVVAEEARARELVAAFVRRHRPPSATPTDQAQAHDQDRAQEPLRVDVLSVFSTTMWVHLAHGDEGLRALLRAAAGLARCLVLEPQNNESYRTARKRLRRMDVDPTAHFQNDLDAALRTSEGLAAFLLSPEACGPAACFTHWRNVGKSSSWGRDLLLFWREEEKEKENPPPPPPPLNE